ncbi:MAG TPA: FAD-binding protein [Acidobacteriota bacterium]|nr:FAD-binding protein [Acidobacteriota bacterium]
MPNIQEFSKVSVLIVGAGPAGLAAAIRLKALRPGLDVCVIDKACGSGHHNLSGAVLEKEPLQSLLDAAAPGWENTDEAKTVLANRIDRDDILFMPCPNKAINVFGAISAAKALGMGWGQMAHHGDYSVSISKLTRWLADIARKKGVELLHGFAADSLILNEAGTASGVRLVDQGVDKEGEHQPN